MESVWSVSKLSTESVGSRRELVANSVHTADADATIKAIHYTNNLILQNFSALQNKNFASRYILLPASCE